MSYKTKFCSRPFEWLEIHGREAYLCCRGWSTLPPIPIGDQSLREVWNHPAAVKFRAAIHDGSFRYCDVDDCPFFNQEVDSYWEHGGSPLKERAQISDPRLQGILESGQTILADGPLTLNCCYDRTCNLSCPSCRNHPVALTHDQIQETLAFQERIFSDIGDQLRLLYISGSGEPFASTVYRTLLQSLSAARFPDLEIHLNTNAQLWTRENWALINGCAPLVTTVHISIDAASSTTYGMNRRGGNWERLLENLALVAELRRSGPLRFVSLSFVVQPNNVREMPAFVGLVERFGFDLAYFHKFRSYGNYAPQELKNFLIHETVHPEYVTLLRMLRQDVFGQKNVGLYALAPLRRKAIAVRGGSAGFFVLAVAAALYRFAYRHGGAEVARSLMAQRNRFKKIG